MPDEHRCGTCKHIQHAPLMQTDAGVQQADFLCDVDDHEPHPTTPCYFHPSKWEAAREEERVPDKPTCETCRFAHQARMRLECRRKAPMALPIDREDEDAFQTSWPAVHPHDWCGEHEPPPTDHATSCENLALKEQAP